VHDRDAIPGLRCRYASRPTVAGPVQLVPGTEYLYGVGCTAAGDCLVAGASQVDVKGYSHGVLLDDDNNALGPVRNIPDSNGFGQVACGTALTACATVGAANRTDTQK
jgi:hypothetical protein